MANKRIYYATQAVQLQPVKANNNGSFTLGTSVYPKGLQSVGITTNFTLTQLFELGQQELYDNVEGVPEIEVTLQKSLDGTVPLYLLCMGGTEANHGSGKNIGELANNRVNFMLGVYADTKLAAEGLPDSMVRCTGMYLSSIGYTFPLDGFATEDVTLVGNSKKWSDGSFNGNFSETVPQTAKHAVRRINVNVSGSTIPASIPGGNSAHLQSINVRANLGREAINELGKLAPYCRYVKFPLEVTSEFVTTSTEGDEVNADDFLSSGSCAVSKNLVDESIIVNICGTGGNDTMSVDLGTKNKLTSVNYTGGDTGGGNAQVTYSYQTFNYLKVNVNGTFASG
jgi:hypothetical protein